jgi:hypothetical protein
MPRQPVSRPSPGQRPLATRLAHHKYALTTGFILMAHVSLAAVESHHSAMFTPVMVLAMDFLGFLYLLLRDRSFMAKLILALGAISLSLAAVNLGTTGNATLIGALAVHAAFLLCIIVMMLGRLSKERVVSFDTVMAGVIVYLVMAGFWTQLYAILLLLSPQAIHIAEGLGPHPYSTLYYFSVTTLTTAGFGDVVPVSDLARILAAYEALVGQVYLVVFIALLMGRHFANR